jgi:NADP-dependent 3-hydroxy acid dehydrogenase YdfG
VLGTLRITKALLPKLRANGKSHIVVVTSTAGHGTYENGGSYTNAKFAELALAQTLRLELNGEPIRVTEIAPGMVKTEEFSAVRLGSKEAAEKVYEGVAEPLVAEDIAEAIRWCAMAPSHVNVDSLVIRPVAQAANHKIHRIK